MFLVVETGRDRFGSLDSVPDYGADSPPSTRGGAVSNGIAADFPRTSGGASATTGVPSPYKPPLTPSRSLPLARCDSLSLIVTDFCMWDAQAVALFACSCV